MWRNYLTVFCVFLSIWAKAQKTSFTAGISGREVVTNSVVEVQFTLENGEGSGFEAPDFLGFKVVSGPNKQSSVSIVNGRRSSSKSWSYSILARKPGDYTIGPARIRIGNGQYETQPISVRVVQAREEDPSVADYRIVAQTDTTSYYLGQQIVLNYKLLAKKSVTGIDLMSEDNYLGLDPSVTPQRFNQTTEVIDGVQYNTLIIKQVTLTPSKVGTYELEPLVVRLKIPVGRQRGFFTQTKSKTVSSPGLSLRILPLTAAEKMAVGEFTMTLRPDNTVIRQSDALKVVVRVEGSGNLDLLGPPQISTDGKLDIFDPDISDLKSTYMEDRVVHRRLYTYSMVPNAAGRATIRAKLKYFSLDSMRVNQLTTSPVQIRINPGEAGLTEALAEIDNQVKASELKTYDSSGRVYRHDSTFMSSLPFWVLISSSLLPIWLAWKKDKSDSEWNSLDEAERRRRKAWKRVQSHFENLESKKDQLSVREFYDQAGASFESYLCQKCKILPADFTIDRVITELSSSSISDQLKGQIREVFEKSQASRFAPISSDSTPDELFQRLKELVLEIENIAS